MAGAGAAQAQDDKPVRKVYRKGPPPEKPPLFNGAVSYGNLLFIAGIGAHVPGDIKSHTKIVLDERGTFVSPHKIISLLALYLVREKGLSGDIVKTFSTTRLIERVAGQSLRNLPVDVGDGLSHALA